eukprot:10639481-Prorocentrum_lima.AAC.1
MEESRSFKQDWIAHKPTFQDLSIYCNIPLTPQKAKEAWLLRSLKRFIITKNYDAASLEIYGRSNVLFYKRNVVGF